MPPTTAHDAAQQQQQQQQQQTPQPLPAPDLSTVPLQGLDQQQIMNLLRHLPQVFNKVRLFSCDAWGATRPVSTRDPRARPQARSVTGRSSRDHAFQHLADLTLVDRAGQGRCCPNPLQSRPDTLCAPASPSPGPRLPRLRYSRYK